MTTSILTLTDKTVAHINEVIAKRGSGMGFRIAVKVTGCSGYMYVPEILDEPKPDDIEVAKHDGFTLYIDPECESIVAGTEIDFVKKGMGMEQLEFRNPNVDSTCGCGESFNLKAGGDQDDG